MVWTNLFPLYKITGEGVGTPLAKIVQLPQGNTSLHAKYLILLFNGNSMKKYTIGFITFYSKSEFIV